MAACRGIMSSIPYEQEKAMRLWMKLFQADKKALSDGEKIGLIKRTIEDVVRDVKSDCQSIHRNDCDSIIALRDTLAEIRNIIIRCLFDSQQKVLCEFCVGKIQRIISEREAAK